MERGKRNRRVRGGFKGGGKQRGERVIKELVGLSEDEKKGVRGISRDFGEVKGTRGKKIKKILDVKVEQRAEEREVSGVRAGWEGGREGEALFPLPVTFDAAHQ